jgi:3-phosphoshikimate 1-carboxyvinyltransferase
MNTPGDKSVSQRALILGGLARGQTRITGLLESDDVLATLEAVSRLGATVERRGKGCYDVQGTNGKFVSGAGTLDFGNSGTGVRLMMGAIAGAFGQARLVGDDSLSSRPMGRVTTPLTRMGAHCRATDARLPVEILPAPLTGIDYRLPIASAQVKSAILLAALGASGETIVREDRATRDHTETMLKLFGADITVEPDGEGRIIRLPGPQTLSAGQIDVPGDPSSAAFAAVAALITPGSDVTLTGVMTNPSRTGLYRALERMGANITVTPAGDAAGEMTADLGLGFSALNAIDLEPGIAPSMIDEYPVLAVACAFAKGTSRLRGLAELRAKESDRLVATHALLSANGVEARIDGDDLVIAGGTVSGGGRVRSLGDHRIAMSALVMGLATRDAVTVDDIAMIATSYPAFIDDMTALGGMIEVHS